MIYTVQKRSKFIAFIGLVGGVLFDYLSLVLMEF